MSISSSTTLYVITAQFECNFIAWSPNKQQFNGQRWTHQFKRSLSSIQSFDCRLYEIEAVICWFALWWYGLVFVFLEFRYELGLTSKWDGLSWVKQFLILMDVNYNECIIQSVQNLQNVKAKMSWFWNWTVQWTKFFRFRPASLHRKSCQPTTNITCACASPICTR